MALKEILRKVMKGKSTEGEFSSEDGMTSDEKELEWYRRKQYLENVKRELHSHREKEKNALWKGSKMGDRHEIIKAKNVFKGQKNVFTNKKGIVSQIRGRKKKKK